jgi:hypothetical protein
MPKIHSTSDGRFVFFARGVSVAIGLKQHPLSLNGHLTGILRNRLSELLFLCMSMIQFCRRMM